MAINSYNRFSNILPSSNLQEYIKKSCDETPIDESYFDNMAACPDCDNLADTILELQEYSSMIEQSLQENMFTVPNSILLMESNVSHRALKENMEISKEAIDNIFIIATEAIKQTGLRFYNTSLDLLESDKDMYNKYLKAIEETSMEEFSGIENFAFPDKDLSEALDDLLKYNSNNFCKRVKGIEEDTYYEELIYDVYDCDVMESFECNENWIPTDEDIETLKLYSEGTAIKSSIVEATKHTVDVLNDVQKVVNETLKGKRFTYSNEYQSKKIYNGILSEFVVPLLRRFDSFINMEIMEVASYRRAIISCGRYATGISEDQDVEQVIGEASDAYVFDCFIDD